VDVSNLKPGDVLAVRNEGLAALMIRIDAALEDKPNISNHIAVVHHQDGKGRWWVIAGQPGGVGYAQAAHLLASGWTLNNIGQPGRTDADRAYVAKAAEAMLGTKYDWQAIEDDGIRAFAPKAEKIWNQEWEHTGMAPAHVVCSSFAAYLYDLKGWARPRPEVDGLEVSAREIEPGDWDEFVLANGYNEKITA
jgi:hypothetical protein